MPTTDVRTEKPGSTLGSGVRVGVGGSVGVTVGVGGVAVTVPTPPPFTVPVVLVPGLVPPSSPTLAGPPVPVPTAGCGGCVGVGVGVSLDVAVGEVVAVLVGAEDSVGVDPESDGHDAIVLNGSK